MHRAKCEITDSLEIARILDSTNIGRLATMDAEGYPYVTPVNFVFMDKRIYFHCALKGEKLDNLLREPKVGFEVDRPLAYLEVRFNPDRLPCRAHQFYRSVVIRGRARIVTDPALKTAALNALLAKHEQHPDFQRVTPDAPGHARCHVVEITPIRTTAKADLGQSSFQRPYRDFIAEQLAKRGLPVDLETLEAMGYEIEKGGSGGWKIRQGPTDG
ncbi:MAG: pyridoxamine 5'-phosphate oxidase family protein [Deltaproteobacteria bacterium]|nr:pyridoxamine 5'-phosphate oxidase family protein [Deltaproteobacteria bacterium]